MWVDKSHSHWSLFQMRIDDIKPPLLCLYGWIGCSAFKYHYFLVRSKWSCTISLLNKLWEWVCEDLCETNHLVFGRLTYLTHLVNWSFSQWPCASKTSINMLLIQRFLWISFFTCFYLFKNRMDIFMAYYQRECNRNMLKGFTLVLEDSFGPCWMMSYWQKISVCLSTQNGFNRRCSNECPDTNILFQ